MGHRIRLVASGLGEGGVLLAETCTIPRKGDLLPLGSPGEVIFAFHLLSHLESDSSHAPIGQVIGEQLSGPEVSKGARLRFANRFKSQ